MDDGRTDKYMYNLQFLKGRLLDNYVEVIGKISISDAKLTDQKMSAKKK